MARDDTAPQPTTSRARLRRSGRTLVRVGAILSAIALLLTLIGGWSTRSFLDHISENSVELLTGEAEVSLPADTTRNLYVMGGLVAPGELDPTPVEHLACTIEDSEGRSVAFQDRSAERVGLDSMIARIQLVGTFTAPAEDTYTARCDGLGVVVAPEINPWAVGLRLATLAIGAIGAFAGLSMLLIGGVLLLLVRGDDSEYRREDDEGLPPEEGADEWFEGSAPAEDGDGHETYEDEYVELTPEELDALSPEDIEELVASGALVFEDDDEHEAPEDGAGRGPT